jgi:hypothetical protein
MIGHGRRLDLVAQYHSPDADLDGYLAFIEELIDSYADRIATLQIGEEPNEHRDNRLAPAGLGHLPLVITEHGWPTGPGRPPRRQAEMLRTVVETAARLGIAGYTHFSLRDACTTESSLFCQFGLMTDDYTPKPAFHLYRELIAAHGAAG